MLLVVNTVAGSWWLQQLSLLMEFLYRGLQCAASTPLTTFYFAQSPSWALLLMCLGAVMIVLPLLWPMRVCGVLCCLPTLMWQPAGIAAGDFELTVLDVGQGLSLVIRTSSHVMVYDTGPRFQSGSDTAALVALPYLRSLGIRQLDMVMISHGDDDHAGGMTTLKQSMPVTTWRVGPSVHTDALADANWSRCQQHQHWQWDGVQFELLSPLPTDDEDVRNNTSCVLMIKASSGNALLMGDAEAPVEQRLTDQHQVDATSIVVAGHHGSRTSSISEFVNAVHAQEVIFSAGYQNRWGFPKPDVVSRWSKSGTHTNSTIDAGAITLRVTSQGVSAPMWYRLPQRHYWQDSSQHDLN
jgi:competence protein ComEC